MKIAGVGLIASLVAASVSAQAADIIRCASPGRSDIIVTMGERKLGKPVGCIEGDFVMDMTPCAPDHDYGLSYPTGSAGLKNFVYHWQDYGDHFGGVASFDTSPAKIVLSGGFMGSNGFESKYSFVMDRTTGVGKLEAFDDGDSKLRKKIAANYMCAKAKQRF